jgi:hypothetical protein
MNIHERMKIIFLGIIALICTYAYSMPITVCTRADNPNNPIYTEWGVSEKAYVYTGFADILSEGFALPKPGREVNSSCSTINVPDKQPPFTIGIVLEKHIFDRDGRLNGADEYFSYIVRTEMAPVTYKTHDDLNNCKILISFRAHDGINADRRINMSLSSTNFLAFKYAQWEKLYERYANWTGLIKNEGSTMNCDGTKYGVQSR